ncbi:hypothetical protein BGZ83_004889, partial [Gryganskiella cystojenkinii]
MPKTPMTSTTPKGTGKAPSSPSMREKKFLVKSLTRRHAHSTLNIGQLGSNIDKAIKATRLSTTTTATAAATGASATAATQVRLAVVKTTRRLVRVCNELLRHGQDAFAMYIANTKDLQALKEALFLSAKQRTDVAAAATSAPTNPTAAAAISVDDIIDKAGKKRLANMKKNDKTKGSKKASVNTLTPGSTDMEIDVPSPGSTSMEIDTPDPGDYEDEVDE